MLELLCIILGITCAYLSFNSFMYNDISIIGYEYETNIAIIGIVSFLNSLYRINYISKREIKFIITLLPLYILHGIYYELKYNKNKCEI